MKLAAEETIGFSCRVCVPTFGAIVYECCKVLWERLVPIYMKLPQDSGERELVAANLWQKWDFPPRSRSIGRHVCGHECTKGHFSTVLVTLVDADLKCIAIDVGSYGRNSDGSLLPKTLYTFQWMHLYQEHPI